MTTDEAVRKRMTDGGRSFVIHSFGKIPEISPRSSFVPVMSAAILLPLLLALVWAKSSGQVVLERSRQRQIRRKEDYSFDGLLRRATEECSYIARVADVSFKRSKAIQRIKDRMNTKRVEQFYREQEEDNKRSKEARNAGTNSNFREHRVQGPRRTGRRPPLTESRRPPHPRRNFREGFPPVGNSPSPWGPPPFGSQRGFHHNLSKRSRDTSFSQGTFKDHNNCFSRCVFARMELIDVLGFPQESILRKAVEDYVDNKKVRASKLRRVLKCFDDMKKVAVDDNCIYSTRIFKCMKFDEPATWT